MNGVFRAYVSSSVDLNFTHTSTQFIVFFRSSTETNRVLDLGSRGRLHRNAREPCMAASKAYSSWGALIRHGRQRRQHQHLHHFQQNVTLGSEPGLVPGVGSLGSLDRQQFLLEDLRRRSCLPDQSLRGLQKRRNARLCRSFKEVLLLQRRDRVVNREEALQEFARKLTWLAMEDSGDLVLNLNTEFQPRKKRVPAAPNNAATFRGGDAGKAPPTPAAVKKKQAPTQASSSKPAKVKFKFGGAQFTGKRSRDDDSEPNSGGDAKRAKGERPPLPRKQKKNFTHSLFGVQGSLEEPASQEQTTGTAVEAKNEPVFSSSQFSEFGVHPHLVACLRDRFQITTATEVQKLAIPALLGRRDTLIKSHTGSGKTLAYALPILHGLQEIRPKLTRADGVRAVVIVPTRELALQTYEWFEKLSKACTWVVPGVLMGGEKKKSEKARLRKGLAIVIGTPGRLTDHLEHTESFSLANTSWLVIDEADRMLELGFEESISKIVTLWKEQRRVEGTSVLLSATLTKGVEKLAGLTLENPTTVDVAVESGANELEEFVLPPRPEPVLPPGPRQAVADGPVLPSP
ncbi:hypothetical protein MTO96_005480 [Rhipicephalus appendiculatus]